VAAAAAGAVPGTYALSPLNGRQGAREGMDRPWRPHNKAWVI
jgi:hypothetical protein